jgi:hypothetical protein
MILLLLQLKCIPDFQSCQHLPVNKNKGEIIIRQDNPLDVSQQSVKCLTFHSLSLIFHGKEKWCKETF